MKLSKLHTSLIVLIITNTIPLFGVVFFSWSIHDILLLYWLENIAIGLINVLKMVTSLFLSSSIARFLNIIFIPFFIFHFSGFIAVHGLFLYYLLSTVPEPLPVESLSIVHNAGAFSIGLLDTILKMINPRWFSLLIPLTVSHFISYLVNFIGRSEYLTAQPNKLITDPYRRIIVMHITIIVGTILTIVLNLLNKSQQVAWIVLIITKTVVDARVHTKEHQISNNQPLP